MLRFISFLLGKPHYEPCKSCEDLRNQLKMVNEEKRQLLDHLLDLTKPKVHEVPSTPIEPVVRRAIPWDVRRRTLEANAREQARAIRESQVMEGQKSTEELERELGVDDASQISKTV